MLPRIRFPPGDDGTRDVNDEELASDTDMCSAKRVLDKAQARTVAIVPRRAVIRI